MRDPELQAQEELLYVERVAGHALRTRQDMDRYFEYLQAVHPPHNSGASLQAACRVAKRLVFIALVAFATFQFFAVDVVSEVMTIDKLRFIAPPPPLTRT